jgi:hypothetical protein
MDAEDVAAYRAMTPPEKLTRVLKFTEPQRNESGRALRLVATRVKPQRHPIQTLVETAIGSFGTLVAI